MARSTPRPHAGSPVIRSARAQASAMAAASMGCWSNPGARSPGPDPSTGVGERWPSTVSRSRSQPSRRHPCATTSGRSRACAGREQRLGNTSRWRTTAGARPRPRRVLGRRTDRLDDGAQHRPRAVVPGVDRSDFGRPDAGEGHRMEVDRTLLHGVAERGHGHLAHPLVVAVVGGRAERLDAASPAVVHAGRVAPATLRVTAVARLPADALGADQEPHGGPPEPAHGW